MLFRCLSAGLVVAMLNVAAGAAPAQPSPLSPAASTTTVVPELLVRPSLAPVRDPAMQELRALMVAQMATYPQAEEAAPSRPSWVESTLHPAGQAHVVRVVPGYPADVVVLDGGLYQSLRIGAPCVVERQGVAIGQLMVVASEAQRAAALITASLPGVDFAPGDNVSLQLVRAM